MNALSGHNKSSPLNLELEFGTTDSHFMNAERWQQIDQLFHSALKWKDGERTAFVAQACGGDEQLRLEVESLLASHEQATSFIEMPAGDAAAGLLAERRSLLATGTMVRRYKILHLLGKGGMGDVYLAEDTELHRRIALKLLPSDFTTDRDRVRRFVQEAHAASALNHPNIVTIHEIGQLDDAHFIVTEFIEGGTLRERLRAGEMQLADTVEVAIQAASALDAAHAEGIVHRDIKPENIMLRRDGYVKVLDFGLAKLTDSHAQSSDFEIETDGETNPGVVMGTVAYMSPEQARGLTVDARSDLWSLGVVLYEMLTGRVPFVGETPSHVIVSILESEPPRLAHGAEAPEELERIVTKTLQKNKEERYQTAGDLAFDLRSLKQELADEARWKRPLNTNGSVEVGIKSNEEGTMNRSSNTTEVAARPTSSAQYLVREIKRHKGGALFGSVGMLTVLAVFAYFSYFKGQYFAMGGEPIDSVAVLPFVNVSGDPNTEYLSEGISDSIINGLSQLPGVRVTSLNSVLRYKGKQTDPQVVGRDLNVRAVLISRLDQQGDNLAISTELVDVRDNRRLWGEQYNRKLSDIIVVQSEIAREISENLRLRLSSQDKKQLAKRYTENGDAYQLYLLGQYHLRKASKEGFENALKYFEQAIIKDPAYAPAYTGVAEVYGHLGLRGLMAPKEAQQRAESATRKALELDDTLAEAHVSLGYIKKRDWDWTGAEKELKRALELNPGSAHANEMYGTYFRDIGKPDAALVYAKRAYEINGLSPSSLVSLANAYLDALQFDRAIELYVKAIEMDMSFAPAHANLGAAYLAKGMNKEAIEELQKAKASEYAPERKGRFAWLAYAYAASGRKDEAQKMLAELKGIAKQRYIPPYNFALICAALGNKDQAFEWLEKAYEEHSQQLALIKSDWLLQSLHSDPRYSDLLRRINLAP